MKKRCELCKGLSVYENILYESKKIYKCLSCNHEEPADHIKVKSNALSSEDINLLHIELRSLIKEISFIEERKAEAERIYKLLEASGEKPIDIPWAGKGIKTSMRYYNCEICGKLFGNRQSYSVKNGIARCRRDCTV